MNGVYSHTASIAYGIGMATTHVEVHLVVSLGFDESANVGKSTVTGLSEPADRLY
jgi:hypothetical protein